LLYLSFAEVLRRSHQYCMVRRLRHRRRHVIQKLLPSVG
jgi:hypothetical protein